VHGDVPFVNESSMRMREAAREWS